MNEITPEVQKRVDEREKARRDKMFLATEILGYDFQPFHQELFDCLIPFSSKKAWRDCSPQKDRLILWPRGHYKTTAAIVEIISAIINNPDVRILLMRGSMTVTQGLLAEVKAHFLGLSPRSRFKELFSDFCTDDKAGTVNAFTTPARVQKQLPQATITVASPRAIKTGSHYDLLVADDLVNESNWQSAKKLEKCKQEFRAMVPLIDPGGYRLVLGTRYAHSDLYADIIRNNENADWVITVKTCYSDDGTQVRFEQRTLPDGRVIGFTREGLLKIMAEDSVMFSSQYLNRVVSGSQQIFTNERMLACVVAETDSPALSAAVLFVDLASSTGVQADDSVILCGKTDHLSNIYITDGIGGQWGPAVLAAQIIEMSLKHRPIKILIEKTASCAYFVEYLRVVCRDKQISLPIDFIKISNVKDAKNIRIGSLEGHIRSRRLRFFAGLPCWPKMLQQFVEWPKGSYGHDDYADTVALAAQTFGAAYHPVTPLSSMKHPLLAEMDRLEAQQAVAGVFTQDGQITKHSQDSMGAEFE